jgi:hypothetical protein
LLLICIFSLAGSVLILAGIEAEARRGTKEAVSPEKLRQKTTSISAVDETLLYFRPLLYCDDSLKVQALRFRGIYQAIDEALDLINLGKHKRAKELLESSNGDQELENNPWYWTVLAYAQQQLGDFMGARESLRTIFTLPELETRMVLLAWAARRELGDGPDDETANHVLGVVVEIGVDSTIVIMAGYADGTSRLLLGSGGGVLGEKEDFPPETVVGAMNLVRAAQPFVSKVPLEQNQQLPTARQVRFALLTAGGIHVAKATLDQLEREQSHAFHPLWVAAKALRDPLLKIMSEEKGSFILLTKV